MQQAGRFGFARTALRQPTSTRLTEPLLDDRPMPQQQASSGDGTNIVVGAGIVGLSCAFWLGRNGRRVTVVDRDPAGDKASFGNAGAIAVTEVAPAAAPGLIWRIPSWLFDPLGPLSIRPAHAPRMIPWFRHFLRAGTPKEVRRVAALLAALNARSHDDIVALLAAISLQDDLHCKGALSVYETQTGFERDAGEWALRAHHGIRCEVMDGDAARAIEPALGPLVCKAVLTPQWSHVSDPRRIVDRLREFLVGSGVHFVASAATAIEHTERPGLRLTDGTVLTCDALVVAAGAWSAQLAATLGDRVLLESERGYNVTIPDPPIALRQQLIFAERKFVATPLAIGLRIGGAAEFAGLSAPANHARALALLRSARRYLPDLATESGTTWMGQRPSTPDSLPVIGPSPRHGRVFYAFGHGHLGLTQSSTTGRLIADLVAGRAPQLDVSSFGVGRFA